MKYALVLMTLCSTAFAGLGNDGPHGAPPLPPSMPRAAILAEKVQHCGFMCPGGNLTGTRILADGIVEQYAASRDEAEHVTSRSRLGAPALQKLVRSVNALRPSELVDTRPNQPPCMDAPSRHYYANARGRKVDVAAWMGCHDWVMKNGQGRDIRKLLDGIESDR